MDSLSINMYCGVIVSFYQSGEQSTISPSTAADLPGIISKQMPLNVVIYLEKRHHSALVMEGC